MVVTVTACYVKGLIFSSVGVKFSESWDEARQAIPRSGSIDPSVSVPILMRANLSEGSEHKPRDNCGQGSDGCHNMSQTESCFLYFKKTW